MKLWKLPSPAFGTLSRKRERVGIRPGANDYYPLPFTGEGGPQGPGEGEQGIRAACGAPAERWHDAAGHAPCKGANVTQL